MGSKSDNSGQRTTKVVQLKRQTKTLGIVLHCLLVEEMQSVRKYRRGRLLIRTYIVNTVCSWDNRVHLNKR